MGRALYSRDRSLSYLLACPWHEQHAAFYFKPRPKRQCEQESLLLAKGPKTDSDDEERLSRDLRNLSRNRSQVRQNERKREIGIEVEMQENKWRRGSEREIETTNVHGFQSIVKFDARFNY
jgi:hypothetical protein